MNSQIEEYPYFLLLNNTIMNLPSDLTSVECAQLARFLNEYKGIAKIEYLELVRLIDDTDFVTQNPLENVTLSHDISLPKSLKLLRTSRNFPFFTILRRVSELPTSLTFLELRRLAEYLDEHKNILSITYEDLYNSTNNPAFDLSTVYCGETLTKSEKK